MSESTFSADLDALVRGETIASDDELTRFVTDLYGEKRSVIMPNALKLRIADDLGLTVADESSTLAAPVSRRTQRASEEERRSSRPWAIAFAIAAAILLALTGILHWGMPTGNDEPDNRFLFSSPAVPTISATPSASPEATSEWWMTPYTDADCPEDQQISRGDWIDLQSQQAQEYVYEGLRKDQPYSVPDSQNAELAVIRQRQAMACKNSEQNRGAPINEDEVLPVESPRRSWENSAEGADEFQAIGADRVQRSMALSAYVENELGLGADDLLHVVDGDTGLIWEPLNAVQMSDGRIALIPGGVVSSTDSWQSVEGWAPVWVNVDGEWLLDEDLFFCIGDCEEYWEQRESLYVHLATPVASPEASPVAEQSWPQPIAP